jgi:hypothetical protein
VPSFGADINECTEGLHNCTKSGPCVNIVGSYICNYTVNGRDVTHTAVWAVTGTLLILLLAVGIVTATAYRLHNRKKRHFFYEMTATELDPYYTPTFWNGSLASIHSTYEKLTFSGSKTDIGGLEKRGEGSARESRGSTSTLGEEEEGDVAARVPVASRERGAHNTADHHTRDAGSHGPLGGQDQPGTNSTAANTGAEFLALLGVQIIPNIGSRVSSPNETAQPHVQTDSATIGGEVMENEMAFETTSNLPNKAIVSTHRRDEELQCATAGISGNPSASLCAGYISEDSVGKLTPPTPGVSGHSIASETSRTNLTHSSCSMSVRTQVDHSRQESSTADTPRQDDQLDEVFTVADTASSGYASGSLASESLTSRSERMSTQSQTNQLIAHSGSDGGVFSVQTTGRDSKYTLYGQDSSASYSFDPPTFDQDCSDDSTNLFLAEVQDAGLEGVKFTVNPHQEFEYINAMKDTLSGIRFEICS